MEAFDLFKLKVDGLTEMERECVPILGETAITPSVTFGDVTRPGRTGAAIHACFYVGRDL